MRACLFILRLLSWNLHKLFSLIPIGHNLSCGCSSLKVCPGNAGIWGQPSVWDNRIQLAVSAITSYTWCKRNVYFNVISLHIFIIESGTSNFWVCEMKISGSSSWRKWFLMFTGLSKLFVVITGTNIILEFPCVFAKKTVPFHDGLTLTPPVHG